MAIQTPFQIEDGRRKFWSQTPDNMDRWKAEMGRVREEKRRRKKIKKRRSKRESLRKKIQVREKVGESRNTVFSKICGSGGSKSRLAKAAGAGWPDERWKIARRCGTRHISKSKVSKTDWFGAQLEVEMSKKCTPSWREAHFQVKVSKTDGCGASWPDERWKIAGRCGARHISKLKMSKTDWFGAQLEVEMSKKRMPLWREANCQVKSAKSWGGPSTLSFRVASARDCAPCRAPSQKRARHEGFVAVSRTVAGVGQMQRIWQDAFRVARAVHEICSSELLGGPGADFLRGVAFWSIRSSVLGRWFCVTGAALRVTWHHFFVAGAAL